MKCLVHGCLNHDNEGHFEGELCSPCHYMLTTGKIGPTHAFFGKLKDENDMLRGLLKDIGKRASEMVRE